MHFVLMTNLLLSTRIVGGVWGTDFVFRMYLELRRLVVVKRGNVLYEVAMCWR